MPTLRIIFPLFVLAALQGCSYAISPDMVRKADPDVTFKQLQAEPDFHRGKIVILGGTIASVLDRKDGTLLEIAEKKLDYWGKPRRTDKSGGRFLVLHAGHLDAMLYAPGRDITVAGEAAGEEHSPQGASPLPLLRARELRAWPRERLTWDKPQWIDPLYDQSSPQGQYGY